jgi:hypothetical protein
MNVEILRRLTTISGQHPRAVWDARVVDTRGHVLWACDHGHGSAANAVICATDHMETLQAAS